jgi:hypothetical protein
MVELTTGHRGVLRLSFAIDLPRALAAFEGTTATCEELPDRRTPLAPVWRST